eukprot:TRINITY_DN12094_c0_g1_i5.p2 TRINITY_DN12094_c0_g1~~TRINITY_DN12094_c0_g1_i5.p2  ORF type:complete len:183 (+),score=52.46 TRINITY_DN12094_c0_g1_i5:363-911(+)
MAIAAAQGQTFSAHDFVVAIDTVMYDKHIVHAPQEFAHAVALIAGLGKAAAPVLFSQALITASVKGDDDFFLTPQDFGLGLVAALERGYPKNLTMLDLAVAVQICNQERKLQLRPQDFGEAVGRLFEAGILVDPIHLSEGIAFVANVRGIKLAPTHVEQVIMKQVQYGTYKNPMLAADTLFF